VKIEYVSHACLSIDTGDLKIVTDPWLYGPAYCGQWHVFPRPVNTKVLDDCDVVLFSHGHEDHFHPRTLKKIPKGTELFYPYTWYGGIKPYLSKLGFHAVTEAPTHKTIRIARQTSITYLVNNQDSIIVVEANGTVLVDINDALHAYPPQIADAFIEYIRERWPHIDSVFCGFGGANYFPNTIHCPGKNDVEIAEAREQLFVHAFCRIVHALNPKVAVPFAADFVLLRRSQRWINETRFPRPRIADYYRQIYGDSPGGPGPQIHAMYPGDLLIDNKMMPHSPYRAKLRADSLNHLIEEEYQQEIVALQKESWLSEGDIDSLEKQLLQNLVLRMGIFDPQALSKIEFSLKVSDIREKPFFTISMKSGKPRVERCIGPSPEAILQVEIPSKILHSSFGSEWGGDAIIIGYGCEIQVFRPEIIEADLDLICLGLLTRRPSVTRHWKREPLRMARYILSNPMNRKWTAQAAWNTLRGQPAFPPNYYNEKMRPWLLRTKCEVCRACDLPVLDQKFAATL
jgi:G:T-mismatch repair DNA endonuclease (very short patch repair protein)